MRIFFPLLNINANVPNKLRGGGVNVRKTLVHFFDYYLIMFRKAPFYLYLILAAALAAQTTATRTVQATGSATLSANPDQAQIDVGVVTVAATAQDSAQQNATQTTAVLNAVKAVLGANGTIQTVSYYVQPRYTNTNPSTINGYTTSNTVRVVTLDLSIIGKLIDAANAAGANTVGSLNFGLQDSEPLVAAGVDPGHQTGRRPRRRHRHRPRRQDRLRNLRAGGQFLLRQSSFVRGPPRAP